jgi:hypothetical protein
MTRALCTSERMTVGRKHDKKSKRKTTNHGASVRRTGLGYPGRCRHPRDACHGRCRIDSQRCDSGRSGRQFSIGPELFVRYVRKVVVVVVATDRPTDRPSRSFCFSSHRIISRLSFLLLFLFYIIVIEVRRNVTSTVCPFSIWAWPV